MLLLFVVGGIIFLSNSYALFKKEIAGRNVELKVGELSYNLESEKLENNQITLKPNSSKMFEVTLASLNEIDSKYELFYKIISPDTIENTVDGGYLETSENPSSGVINANSSKNIQLVLNNFGNQEITIEIGVQAGLTHNEVVLNDGEITLKEKDFQKQYVYDYTGEAQEFVVPKTGAYKVELWGASSFGDGNGSYTKGVVELNESDENLYIYVGGQAFSSTGGYNGGGNAGTSDKSAGVGGGGATDIRTRTGVWNDTISLRSRIMVAAGGGGILADAGGLIGYKSTANSTLSPYYGKPGTQIAGGASPPLYNASCIARSTGSAGGFGYGGKGGNNATYYNNVASTGGGFGGGSGYYGGSGGGGICNGSTVGGGGSSFISGHAGCIAIKSEEDQTPKVTTYSKIEDSYHYSEKIFTDTVMIDGAGYKWTTTKGEKTDMPTHDLTSTMTGNTGNGYARITYIGE